MSEGKQNKTKLICLIFLMLVLLLPIGQKLVGLFKIEPLVGYFEKAPKPVFTFENWFEGTYQAEKEKYIDQHYGFRDLLVRVNNQMDFWLFKKLHAENVLCGKDGMLYEKPYIESYLGKDFLGEDSVNRISEKLKVIQEGLAARNKTLIIILAPGKGTYFPDKFPDRYDRVTKTRNNYEAFSERLKEKAVNTIDVNSWFLSQKGKSKHPLFTELGIHWTLYGSSCAFDSLIKYIEFKRNIDLPDYLVNGYETPDELRPPDNDIYNATNVLVEMNHEQAAYPIVEIRNNGDKTKPTLLTIADSFWWNIYNTGQCRTVFNDGRFWYYNNEAFPESLTKPTKVGELDFNKVIDGTDIVVLCYTDCNLSMIGNGVIERLANYCSETTVDPKIKEEKIKNTMAYIRTDKVWIKALEERAKKEHRSLDSLIYIDAKWHVEVYQK